MSRVIEALQPIVMAFAVFMMVYLFLVQPHKVDGSSMYPNFHDKEFILTDKISYRKSEPQRGDVIIFHAPPPFDSDFIKRVIGLPGESVMVKNNKVFINNKELPEPYIPEGFPTSERSFLREGIPYIVPPDFYMVMGDNRNFSSDSREWGPISKNSIVGKAWFRYWPYDEIGLIKHQSYLDFKP
jgi:signal peptidase I